MPNRSQHSRFRFGTMLVLFCLAIVNLSVVAQDATAPANVVPQGTTLLIQLADRIDAKTVKAGDHFQARLIEPLVAANGMTIDSGAKIKGHVSAVEPGLRTRVILSFEDIETAKGWMPLIATVTGVPGEHGLRRISDEGEIGRQGMTNQQIAEAIAVSAGKAAAEGEKSGGTHGAVTAAGSAAAASALTAFESGHDLILEKGTALEIRLDRNLAVGR